MEAHEALMGRFTTQSWLPDAVPDAVIARALAAAHQAPCHKCSWPWRFTRVGPEGRRALADVGVALKRGDAGAPLPDAQRAAVERKMLTPGELLVVSQVLSDDLFRRREDYAAVAAAVQNLMLSVHADGFGSKWGTGAVTRDPRTYACLGIDPSRERIEGFVFVGRSAGRPTIERPPLDAVVRRVP